MSARYVFEMSTTDDGARRAHHTRYVEWAGNYSTETLATALQKARDEFPDVKFTGVTLAYVEDE